MGNTRLDQEKTTIYTLIKSIVEIIQEVVFDPENEMTGKDYEQVFLYATSLVDYHDYLSNRKLNETVITSCILTLLNDLEIKYAYSQQQISDLKKNVPDELAYFAEAFDAYLSEKDKEAALMKYVSTILSRFPSAKSTSAFSITGVEFAQIFTHAVTKIAEIYADLTKNTSDNGISLSQESVVTAPPASAPSFGKPRKNLGLILCAPLLLCSIVCNGWLYTENTSLKEDLFALEKEVATREYENTYWFNAFKEKFVEARGNAEILEAHNFYNNYAVIITEQDSCYHKYGCSHLNLDSFWIYNVDAAINDGFVACPNCNPPQ